MKICDIPAGYEAVVTAVGGCGREKRRLLDLGFVRGTKIRSVGCAPGGKTMEFFLRGYNVVLRRSTAFLIEAEQCRDEGSR